MAKLENMLDALLKDIENDHAEFYKRAIELHENQKLRSLAKARNNGFCLVKGQWDSSDDLYYTENGFEHYAKKQGRYVDCGDYSGHYDYSTIKCPYQAVDNELKSTYNEKTNSLLETFPEISIEKIESTLEKEIKKFGVKRK